MIMTKPVEPLKMSLLRVKVNVLFIYKMTANQKLLRIYTQCYKPITDKVRVVLVKVLSNHFVYRIGRIIYSLPTGKCRTHFRSPDDDSQFSKWMMPKMLILMKNGNESNLKKKNIIQLLI
jgi:hypothetical protein